MARRRFRPSGEQIEARKQWLKRYEKHRQRNVLAEPGPFEFAIVLDSLKAGFNVPKVFRSADAFGAREVHLVDIGPFDPAPAKGAFKSVPARFHDCFDPCYRDLSGRGYTLFTLEPERGVPLHRAELPAKSAFIFGHEEHGLSFDPLAYDGIEPLTIPQFGKVQSLNVSVAASIVMYEYVRRFSDREGPHQALP